MAKAKLKRVPQVVDATDRPESFVVSYSLSGRALVDESRLIASRVVQDQLAAAKRISQRMKEDKRVK